MANATEPTKGVSTVPELIQLQCSCSACDAIVCFTKRQMDHQSTCDVCKCSKTFLFLNNNKSHSTIDVFDDNEIEEQFAKEFNEEMMSESEIAKDTTNIMNEESEIIPKLSTKDKFVEGILNNNNSIDEVNVTKSGKNVSQSAAKLSAQIMDIVCSEESFNYHNEPKQLDETSKYSLQDLFQKIKQVYEACSCKVCECLVGKSQNNELCRCKPCECDTCSSLKNFADKQSSGQNVYHLRRPGVNCSCRERTKSEFNNGCKYVKRDDSIPETCASEPCQFSKCKSFKLHKYQTLVAAAADDNTRAHQKCQCSPCECIVCGQRCGVSSNLQRREKSTKINKHPRFQCEMINEICLPDKNNSCRCERHDTMIKPLQRESADYDIRNAVVIQDNKDRERRSHPQNNSHRKKCNCTHKESSTKNVSKINNSMNCKCSPDDCTFCNKNYYVNDKLLTSETPCNFNRRYCSKCERLTRYITEVSENKTIQKFSSYNKCRCSPSDNRVASCSGDICDCVNCICKRCNTKDEVILYPIKKGEKITPAILQNQIYRSSTKLYDEEKRNGINSCFTSLVGCKIGYVVSADRHNHLGFDSSYEYDFQINSMNNEKQASSVSSYYSIYNCNDKESVSPQLAERNKSCGSSCNSSGHDYSNYLVQFPKSTSETSDTVNLNIRTKIHNIDVASRSNSITKNYEPQIYVDNEYAKSPVHNNYSYIPSRSTLGHGGNAKLCYDECSSVENESVSPEQVTVSSQCSFVGQENLGSILFSITPKEVEESDHIQKKGNANDLCVNYSKVSSRKVQKPKHVTIKSDFILDDDDDDNANERGEKTLKTARKFSQKLKKWLEKYEKANREFVSVSQKLSHPDGTHKESVMNKTALRSSDKALVSQRKILNSSEKDCIDDTMPTKDYLVQFSNDTKSESMTSENVREVNKGNENEGISSKNYIKLNSFKTENNYVSDVSLVDGTIRNDTSLNPIIEERESLLNEIDYFPTRRQIKKKGFSKIYRRAVIGCKRNKRFVPNIAKWSITTETSDAFIIQINNMEHNQLFKTGVNRKCIDQRSIIEQGDAIANVNLAANINAQRSTKNVEPKRRFRTYNVSEAKDNILMIKAPVEFESSTALNTKHDFVKKTSHKNEVVTWKDASCEAMKVSFLTARRMSDKTVMVSWTTPRNLQNVEGYEVLVDGRVVQKISDAIRCVAMIRIPLTSEKILVTVRTVTISPSSSGHNPSATIVYNSGTTNKSAISYNQ